MRKTAPFLLLLGALLFGTAAFAGSIDYLSNQSVEYLMNFSRNAATDAADAASYNPAGLAFLPKDGFYLNSSYQQIYLRFSETYGDGLRFEQDQPNPIPALFNVYKKGNVAAFFAVNVTAGGGWVRWKEGDATTAELMETVGIGAAVAAGAAGGTGAYSVNESWIEGFSAYTGIMAGLAYKINDKLSVSAAPRYMIAERKASAFGDFSVDALNDLADGGTTLFDGNETRIVLDDNFDYNARGLGGVFGLDIKPSDNLNIGIRYETVTKLNFRHSVNVRTVNVTTAPVPAAQALAAGLTAQLTGALAELDQDGESVRYDLPAVLGLGVDLAVTPGFHLLSSANYYFIENAVWEGKGDDYRNGYEVSLGTMIQAAPKLKIGLGYNYTVQGEKQDALVNENPGLDSHAFAAGFSFAATPNLDLKLAGAYTRYIDNTKTVQNVLGQDVDIDYHKLAIDVAAGFEYRFDL